MSTGINNTMPMDHDDPLILRKLCWIDAGEFRDERPLRCAADKARMEKVELYHPRPPGAALQPAGHHGCRAEVGLERTNGLNDRRRDVLVLADHVGFQDHRNPAEAVAAGTGQCGEGGLHLLAPPANIVPTDGH